MGVPVSELSGRCLTRENQTSLEKFRTWQPQAFHETESIQAPGNCESQAHPWESLSSADFPWHFWSWRIALEYPFIHARPSNDLLAEVRENCWPWSEELNLSPGYFFHCLCAPGEQFLHLKLDFLIFKMDRNPYGRHGVVLRINCDDVHKMLWKLYGAVESTKHEIFKGLMFLLH